MVILARRGLYAGRTLRAFSTSASRCIEIQDRDAIRWITLDRPQQLNALTITDLEDLTAAVEDAPDSVRAIALKGAGRALCAGMNTTAFAGLSSAEARDVISKVARCVGSFRLSPKPTAVLIHGYCLGAAFEMALAADFRISSRDAKVGLPETKVGIPSVVDAALLRHHVGLSFAKEMLLVGDIYPVERLGGFVNRWDEGQGLEKTTEELLSKVTCLTPTVMKAQKELHESWHNLPLKESIAHSIDVFADVFGRPETHEAVRAYNARKK